MPGGSEGVRSGRTRGPGDRWPPALPREGAGLREEIGDEAGGPAGRRVKGTRLERGYAGALRIRVGDPGTEAFAPEDEHDAVLPLV